MRIGIDARAILNPQKNPSIGVGHYTFQLIKNLLKIDQRNKYELFFDYCVREKDVKKFSKPNVQIRYFPWSDYKKYLPGAYSEILGLATLSGKDLEVLHVTSPDARVPLGYRGKVVCTFQDLAVYKQPRLFPSAKRIKAKYNRKAMATRADMLIAVSENTKHDLIDIFGIADNKIKVINNGVDQRFFQDFPLSKDEIKNELKNAFKIDGDYILFVGTLEPVKNITRLIHAFKIFKEKNSNNDKGKYKLVLAGKKGWLTSQYLQIAKDSGVENDIIFLGYVEGEDLRKLFKGTKLFVMPSLYEGFGMTVLEAMASKTACLVSEIDPLRKIAGDAVEYINPFDINDMVDKIDSLVDDENAKEILVSKGIERARNFSWEKCAKETLEIYELVAGKKE